MKMSEDQILAKIAELKSDERLSYAPATIFANAPLAVIQTALEVELHTLERVLGLPRTPVPIKAIKAFSGISDGRSKIRK